MVTVPERAEHCCLIRRLGRFGRTDAADADVFLPFYQDFLR